MMPMAMAQILLGRRCDTLSTSGFFWMALCFSYHRANGPESNTTIYFDEARQVAAPVG